ncbi:MAG: exopolysaccharide biosynthesis polyprenyl glycosylphosphotransferase [Kaistella sp.]|nr:exopolysaccharide biosynthesis polyprenyl glycosylphosphotransferase [Kaistella sp.]
MQRIRYSRYFKSLFILLDVLIVAGVLVFYFSRSYELKMDREQWEQNAVSLVLLTFFWILLSGRTKLYSIPRNLTYTLYVERLLTHILIFIFGLILFAKVSDNDFLKQDRYIIALSLFLVLSLLKSLIFFTLKYIRSRGLNYRNVMFLQENESAEILKNILNERKDYGFRIFNYPNKEFTINELIAFWKDNGIHTLFLPTETSLDATFENEIFQAAEIHKVRLSLIPNFIQNNFFSFDLGYIETQPVLTQTKYPLDFLTNYILKRGFDIVFSALILVGVCSWLFPLIALLIKMDSKGPVFFLQKRYGYHDEIFKCFKFRTMVVNDRSSTQTTWENDVRITKIGKILRKTSLDEMPQFINVLMGKMSVVGPRPHMLLVDEFYKPKIGRYTLRSFVKPGITGLAQVNGLRGDHGDMKIQMHKRILADSFYVRNWTFVLDLVIILKTVFLLIGGDNNAK